MSYQEKIEQIIQSIREKESLLVAFSGGVDSSVVTALAYKALGDKALAVTVDSPLLPAGELEDARRVTGQIGIGHLVVRLNELEVPGLRDNPPNRCYLCKKFRFGKLKQMAVEKGFRGIADGTNLSDLGEYRPGLKALEEMGVYSPLLEAGLAKADTRKLAELMGLVTAEKLASACLATRVPYGHLLTAAQLERIDRAESYIKSITGVKVLRVRDHGNLARIEAGAGEKSLFLSPEISSQVARRLKELGYEFVTLDLQGYRSGSFDGKLRQEKSSPGQPIGKS